MALFNKLFFSSSNKRKTISNTSNSSNQSHNNYLSQFPFNSDQVRVLLYRECDNRGRRLLFDSSAIEKIDLKKCSPDGKFTINDGDSKRRDHQLIFNTNNGFIEISDGFAYKHSRPNSSDISSLGEMIFGALAMSFRGTALKIHWLQSPVRILCSQVFLTPLHSKFTPNKDSSGTIGSSIYTPSIINNKNSENCSNNNSNASFNSLSMPFTVCVNKNLNLLSSDKDLTKPVSVPNTEMSLEGVQLYSTLSGEDSGYSGTISEPWTSSTDYQYSQFSTRSSLGSVFSDTENSRKLSIDSVVLTSESNKSSDMSLRRRISRNISTSFENQNSISDFIGFIGDNYQTETNGGSDGCMARYRCTSDSHDSRSNPEMIRNRTATNASGDSFLSTSTHHHYHHNRHMIKRPKLGLAVCITMTENFEKEMEQFCCEHIALFESMLCRLRASAENAYLNHRNFLQIMVKAWKSIAKWVHDLFTAPRVHSPVWLNINGGETRKTKILAESFMKELTCLLSFADTKDTNFFISTMLTALLTYHLGWVSTITAFKSNQYSHVDDIINEQKAKMLEISQKHPYNALWAQMGDLYGSVGNPPRISRTIVYGTEKHIIEKLLHVLTYFIRCENVKRISKTKTIDSEVLKDIIQKKINTIQFKNTTTITTTPTTVKKSGLTRSPTCFRNLLKSGQLKEEEEERVKIQPNTIEEKYILRVNDDTKNTLQQKHKIENLKTTEDKIKSNQILQLVNESKIRFTVTTPDNIEMAVNYSESEDTTSTLVQQSLSSTLTLLNEFEQKTNQNEIFPDNRNNSTNDGKIILLNKLLLSKEDLKNSQNVKMEEGNNNISCNIGLRKSVSMSHLPVTHLEPIQYELSDEDTKSEKETNLLNSIATDEIYHKVRSKSSEGVVFVLGDNEALVNIKKSNENITTNATSTVSSVSNDIKVSTNLSNELITEDKVVIKSKLDAEDEKKISSPTPSTSTSAETASTSSCCCHHHKKHSGVKFNFEKYPQIATNYMKNKNLDLSSYDFFDKSSKFDEYFKFEPSTSAFHVMTLPKSLSNNTNNENGITDTTDSTTSTAPTLTLSTSDSCEVCKYCSSVRVFQTPSNATELEFETEDDQFEMKIPTSMQTTLEGGKCGSGAGGGGGGNSSREEIENGIGVVGFPKASNFTQNMKTIIEENEKLNNNDNTEDDASKIRKDSSQRPIERCKSVELDLIQLPLPNVEESPTSSNNEIMEKSSGFVPSLLIGVSDHYIPDMVLQGIITPPNKWEIKLKQDLVLSSHCATLMPAPVENVAIIADMSKWDVKIISSQNYGLPHNDCSGNPIGMSQLVSTMLETVHAMSCSGISAYECLSYIESKLQEMYLQSETLAAFLLATEFCSLNTVTAALNLSANDVPLLLSVASVHSPQVTRKYGISFR